VLVEAIETEIRDAVLACEVIRRSISELCSADHLNDPVILGRWLAKDRRLSPLGLSSPATP
jgi:hypothetical protein